MTSINPLAIQLLALGDSIWLPFRNVQDRTQAAVMYFSRKRWARGVAWRGSGTNTERVRDSRELNKLQLDGLVKTSRSSGRMFARLTDHGDQITRSGCGVPGLKETLVAMRELRELSSAGFCASRKGDTSRTVPEWAWLPARKQIAVSGSVSREWTVAERDALHTLEETFLPALIRGWVRATCTFAGSCWYSLTPAGTAAMEKPSAPLKGLPKSSDDCFGQYHTALAAGIRELRSAKPENAREIGLLPIRGPALALDFR